MGLSFVVLPGVVVLVPCTPEIVDVRLPLSRLVQVTQPLADKEFQDLRLSECDWALPLVHIQHAFDRVILDTPSK